VTRLRPAVPGIARVGALSVLALIAVGLTRLVHGSLISHATDRNTYGLVGSLLATSMVASLVLPGGISSAMAKFVALHRGAGDPSAARAIHRFLTRYSVLSGALLGLAAALVAGAIWHLAFAEAAALWLLTTSYSVYSVDKAALYGFGRSGAYACLEILTSGVAVIATIATVAFGWHGYLLPLAIGYTLFVLGARVLLRPEIHAGHAPFDRREVLTYAVVASVGTLAGTGFLQGTQLLASRFAQPAEVAYFAASVALVAPLYFLPRALGLALFPAMAAAHGAGDADGVRRQGDVSTRALAVLLAPVFVAGEFLAPLVLTIFGGAEYAAGAPVLRIMLAATWLSVLQVPAINALASDTRKRARIPAGSAVLGCLTGLGVVAVLGEPLGAVGVAVGYLVGSAITAAIPITIVWRSERMAWTGPLGRSLALLIVGFAAAAATEADHSAQWTVGFAAGGAALAAAVLARDLRSLLRAVRPAQHPAVNPG